MSDLWLPEGPHWDLNIEHHPLKGGTGSFAKGGWKLVAHTTQTREDTIDALVAGWLMRNQKTPGGVPLKK
jgi:hypothetical protein